MGNSAFERVGGHFPVGIQGAFNTTASSAGPGFDTKGDCLLPPATRTPTLRGKRAPAENLVACSPGLLRLPLELPLLWASSGAVVMVIPALEDSSGFLWTHPGSWLSAPGLTFPLLALLPCLNACLLPVGKKNSSFGLAYLGPYSCLGAQPSAVSMP